MHGMLRMPFHSCPKAIDIDEIYKCSYSLNYHQLIFSVRLANKPPSHADWLKLHCDISFLLIFAKYVSIDSPLLIGADELQSKYISHQYLM